MGLLQQPFKRLQPVCLGRQLIPPEAVNTREAHRQSRLVAAGPLQTLEGDFQYQTLVFFVHNLAHRAEAGPGMATHESVDLKQLLIGKPK